MRDFYLARIGDGSGGLSEPVRGGSVLTLLARELASRLGHGLGLDPRHDLLPLELPHLLPQVPVGLLSVFVGVEGDVPGVVESILTRDYLRAAGTGEQILRKKTNSMKKIITNITH